MIRDHKATNEHNAGKATDQQSTSIAKLEHKHVNRSTDEEGDAVRFLTLRVDWE